MKITETRHGQPPESSLKKTGNSSSTGTSFQKVMEQMNHQGQASTTETKGMSPALPPDGVQIIKGPEPVHNSLPSERKEMVLRELGETLDMIDSYAAGLKNSSIPASDMKPLMEHLEGRMENLAHMQADPDLPEGLRTIISDLAVTIGAEVAKFERGDYE